MKISAIISEYNPFHNGHKYHIEQTRKNGATHILAVMSGDTVQRGSVALLSKHERARLAVENGVDLVVEIPCPFSCSSAERFAEAGVFIASELGADELSFGSEIGELSLLERAVEAIEKADSDKLKTLLSSGVSYPTALAECVDSDELSGVLSSPNNTLGIEYLRALKKFGGKMSAMTVARVGAEHDSDVVCEDIASASKIRQLLANGEVSKAEKFLPYKFSDKTERIAKISELEKLVLWQLSNMTPADFASVPDSANGLAERICQAVQGAHCLEEVYDRAKTKCFTHARIRRVVLYAVLGVRTEDFACAGPLVPYIRVLAMNERGAEILSVGKKNGWGIPVGTSLKGLSEISPRAERFAELDDKSARLRKLAEGEFGGFVSEFTVKFGS